MCELGFRFVLTRARQGKGGLGKVGLSFSRSQAPLFSAPNMSQDRDTEKKDFTAVVPLVFALDLFHKELLDVCHRFPTSR